MTECDICGKKIEQTNEKPMWICVTGLEDDEHYGQINLDVCVDCFKNRTDGILDKLREGPFT